jgi:hypothetical protein
MAKEPQRIRMHGGPPSIRTGIIVFVLSIVIMLAGITLT